MTESADAAIEWFNRTCTTGGDGSRRPRTSSGTNRSTGVAIYRFNDEGLIDGRWQEFHGLGLFTQLGLIPPMGRGGG